MSAETVERPRIRARTLGTIASLVAAVLFAINGTVAKTVLLEGFPAPRLAELRITGAAIILLIAAFILHPNDLKLSRRDVVPVLLYGLVGVAATQFLYLVAIKRLPIGIALLLEYTAPVFVALWARFVQHKEMDRRVWAAIVLAVTGLALITQFWIGFRLDAVGVIAGLGAALALTVYFIGGEHYVSTRSPVATAALAMTAGALFWAIVQPWWTFPFDMLSASTAVPGFESHHVPLWALTAWIIVLGTVVPYTLEWSALRSLPATLAVLIAMLEPVVAAGIAYFVLDEHLTVWEMLGSAVILAGVILAQTSRVGVRADQLVTAEG